MTKIHSLRSIATLRDAYLRGDVTPQTVMADVIERTYADEPMNIWITPPTMERIQPYVDRLSVMDPNTAPLWGIPFAVKDNIDVAGLQTTAGCPEYAYVPNHHATVVERLVSAGAIPVGKTNLDQFATGLVGTRSPYGETHNALRPELISGGSSSGSAVAVARGHVAFALGTDTAGSGRVPAALNGLIGFKPSLGAWPTRGVVPACASLDCVTVFAQGLDDAWVVDQVVRGFDVDDPWSRHRPHPTPGLPQTLLLPSQPLEFFGPYATEYQRAWDDVVKQLHTLNLPIETIDIDWLGQAASILYEGPWVAERWADLGEFVETHLDAVFPVTSTVLRSGAGFSHDAASVFRAMHTLQSLKVRTRREFRDGVLVMPTIGGTWTRDQVRQDPVRTNQQLGKFTNHCNLLDLCALAVPFCDAMASTPFGVTLFALSENEGLLFGTGDRCLGAFSAPFVSAAPAEFGQSAVDATSRILIAVCGLHMRGFPLEAQMNAFGATFVREDMTASEYKMVRIDGTTSKPGLVRCNPGEGTAFDVEIWEMPVEAFGEFVASIPVPLGIGKVKLKNGDQVSGFLCESYATEWCEDISAHGGWRSYTQHI